MAALSSLVVADPAELWRDLGFVVGDDGCWIDGTTVQLGGPPDGVTGWTVTGAGGLDELPVARAVALAAEPTPVHPNGVTALDHIVVSTPDLARTIAAFETAGIGLRRTREIGREPHAMTQAFFKLDNTIVEVVGSARDVRPGPARFFGLAFTVEDLDATASLLGALLRPAKDAVQRGRRIATLDHAAGSTVPIAFMSPHR